MIEKRIEWLHLLILWLVALVLRIGYLLLAIRNLGLEKLWQHAPDTQTYMTVSQQILSGHPDGPYALFRVGPGYGLILAGIQTLFGSNPIYPMLFSLIVGSLAPVVIYLLAKRLLNSSTMAFIAGAISAISLTSIALSCQILTDQTAFTVHAASLLCFVEGFKTGRIRWFVAAGLLAGIAAFVRPSTQLWPFVYLLIPLFVPLQLNFRSRSVQYKRAMLAGLISLLMLLGWCTRNYIVHDAFTFGSNGALTFRRCVVAQVTANDDSERIIELRSKWERENGDDFVENYRSAIRHSMELMKSRPADFAHAFADNMHANLRAGNVYAVEQVPEIKGVADWLNRNNRHWLSYLTLLLAATGFVMLIHERNRLAWVVLGSTYGYFTLMTAFSFWQGSRLHYPAEMAWSILVAFAVYRLFDLFRVRFCRGSS